MSGLYDSAPIAPRAETLGSGVSVPLPAAPEPAYQAAASRGTFLAEWSALLRSPDREWLPARGGAVARARDLERNDPIASSAVTRRANSAVGRGWRLSSRPDARKLGISIEAARELGAEIESEFNGHAYGHAFESDAERRLTFGQQLRLAARGVAGADGEAVAVTEWDESDPFTRYKTRLRLVDPDRLSNPGNRGLGTGRERFRGGVELAENGSPLRYHFRTRHPADIGPQRAAWVAVDRFTPWGRPQVFHVYEPLRPGQSRGVSRFAAVLKTFRGLSRFADATLEAAVINALIVGFLKSNSGPDAAGENFAVSDIQTFENKRQQHYASNPVSLTSGARLPVLPYGDEIEMATTARDTADFENFFRANTRLIAAAVGVTSEELTMDYSQTNYSSARAAFIPAWAETQNLMGMLEGQLARPYLVCFLEEAFDRGYLTVPAGAPDFYDAIDAYCRGRWLGPPRGYVDVTKEIDAAAARIEAGMSTLEDECADQGRDWEEVLEQTARENAKREELRLAPPQGALAMAGAAARQPQPTAAPPA